MSSKKAGAAPATSENAQPENNVAQDAISSVSSQAQKEPTSEKVNSKVLDEQPISLSNLPLFDQYQSILPANLSAEHTEANRNEIIEKIIGYLDKLAGLKQLNKDYGKGMDTEGLPTMGADSVLKAQALPILNNLTKQLLHAFATNAIHDLIAILSEPKSKAGEVCYVRNS